MTTMSDANTEAAIASLMEARQTRRSLLRNVTTAGLAAMGAGLLGGSAEAQAKTLTDIDILNFALNLEYLEAEYYTYATTGMSIRDAAGIPTGYGSEPGGAIAIKANPKVPFQTPIIQQFAEEIAADERAHVALLRHAILAGGGTPVAQPRIDLYNSFNTAANVAGIGSTFDPFANEINFLIGGYIFEDVGVTAYNGAAPYISDKNYLIAGASILGTEAYHAAGIRTMLLMQGSTVTDIVGKISDLRDSVDGSTDDDQGVLVNGMVNIAPTDHNGLVYRRTFRNVLNIVYLGGTYSGGFFPFGVNGAIV